MRIKVTIDFDDSGEEDAVFQGWDISADIREEATNNDRSIAVDAFFEGVKACIGFGTVKDT